MRYILYKIAKKILLSILVICLILLLVGCSSISNTTVYNIQEYPDKYVDVKVTGIVRHKVMKIGFTDEGIFYIEGESWEYVD